MGDEVDRYKLNNTWDNEILAFNLQDRKRGFSNWVSLCYVMKGLSTPLQTFDLNILVWDYFKEYTLNIFTKYKFITW